MPDPLKCSGCWGQPARGMRLGAACNTGWGHAAGRSVVVYPGAVAGGGCVEHGCSCTPGDCAQSVKHGTLDLEWCKIAPMDTSLGVA